MEVREFSFFCQIAVRRPDGWRGLAVPVVVKGVRGGSSWILSFIASQVHECQASNLSVWPWHLTLPIIRCPEGN